MWKDKKKTLNEQNHAIEKLARDGTLKIKNVPIGKPIENKK